MTVWKWKIANVTIHTDLLSYHFLYSWMVSFAVFQNIPVFIQMIRTLVIDQPIPSSLVSKWRRNPPTSHDMLLICLLWNISGKITSFKSVQELFFCWVYIVLLTCCVLHIITTWCLTFMSMLTITHWTISNIFYYNFLHLTHKVRHTVSSGGAWVWVELGCWKSSLKRGTLYEIHDRKIMDSILTEPVVFRALEKCFQIPTFIETVHGRG